ncbi:MAG: molybdopterin-dependent oxidoreductase [Myxococcota bacterium]|nr:molybdopterin-dependent oxidoreductase [Myxococcota bacterium]
MAQAEIRTKTCPLCEAMCGLRIQIEAGQVTKIRPNPKDVWSQGYMCPKGAALGELHHDPDRIRFPQIKREGRFVAVSWSEAFDEIHRRLPPIIESDGIEAMTVYFGNPVAHNFSLSRYAAAFIPMSNIPVTYSAGTVDQWPKNLSSALLFGGMWTFPIPDVDRCEYLIVMGANPHASQGSLLACADLLGRMDAIRERGGRVIVIDPRRTGTVEHADEWLAIRPGGDAALLMAWVNVLFEENRVDLGELEGRVEGLDRVALACRPFTPEAVVDRTGLAADDIRRIARELASADRAAVYGRIGTCNQEFGTLASWLVDVVNILTAHLDRPGCAMFANPIAWSLTSFRPPEFADGYSFGRWHSRVRGAPEVLGQFPASCLSEEIATPGPGRIRALLTIAGNPVLSTPGGDRLDKALPELDFMISIDNWINETTQHADVILPGQSVLEQPHYDEMIWSWAVRSAGKFSPALFDLPEGAWAEWEVLLMLAALVNGASPESIDLEALDQLFFTGLVAGFAQSPGSTIEGRDPAEIVALTPGCGPERILDFQIRTGPFGEGYGADPEGLTLAKVKAEPNGIDLGPMRPRLDQVISTKSGNVELAPEYILGDLPRLEESLECSQDGLQLISRRHVRSNNSWMHNAPALMTGKDRCTLLIHPEDARPRGLEDGMQAEVQSRAGRVEVAVEVTEEMRPGVVCLPHGFGHDRPGTRLAVASARPGICNNVLAPGDLVDHLSGNAQVNGIPVEVRLAGSG